MYSRQNSTAKSFCLKKTLWKQHFQTIDREKWKKMSAHLLFFSLFYLLLTPDIVRSQRTSASKYIYIHSSAVFHDFQNRFNIREYKQKMQIKKTRNGTRKVKFFAEKKVLKITCQTTEVFFSKKMGFREFTKVTYFPSNTYCRLNNTYELWSSFENFAHIISLKKMPKKRRQTSQPLLCCSKLVILSPFELYPSRIVRKNTD